MCVGGGGGCLFVCFGGVGGFVCVCSLLRRNLLSQDCGMKIARILTIESLQCKKANKLKASVCIRLVTLLDGISVVVVQAILQLSPTNCSRMFVVVVAVDSFLFVVLVVVVCCLFVCLFCFSFVVVFATVWPSSSSPSFDSFSSLFRSEDGSQQFLIEPHQ